MLIAASLL